MLSDALIVLCALAYLGVLFAVAWHGDRRADAGRSLIANPWLYTLSLGVYCTAWTFYGSVGRAAGGGVGFLPVYLGPTLVMLLGWVVVRRIVRITKVNRITSIADFIASRYGKSQWLAGLVTVIAVLGIMPYISIQLKAIALSFAVLRGYPEIARAAVDTTQPVWADTTFYAALMLVAFTILFGTRHIDNTERHEGLVAAIAFESLIKLVAFVAVGAFVTWGLYGGFGDLFARAAGHPQLARLLHWEAVPGGYGGWFTLLVLAMAAFLFLPRQFQVLVVENVDESHLRTASWAFPLYLWGINLFVLPVALGGLLLFEGRGLDPDLFVLDLPMLAHEPWLALIVFIGGLSAATSMVIMETVALSTMVCNDLVMPVLLRLRRLRLTERGNITGLLLAIRRGAISVTILLGYVYFRAIGDSYALVSIGLVSFAAAAQFAPAILIGLYWRRANRLGATLGLGGGFAVWAYTLLLPSFAKSGWLSADFVEFGAFGWELLKPYALFGLHGLDPYSHALFWSLFCNVGGLVAGALLGRQDAVERVQASRFVDIYARPHAGSVLWRGWQGRADFGALRGLVERFLGRERAANAFDRYAREHGVDLARLDQAGPDLLHYAESLLAGAIGAASAQVVVASVVTRQQQLGIEEVMAILEETSQAIEYSRQLEQKSRELQAATDSLREANARLQELDRLKDEFVSTVTHELRTPLTSIRAFAEIMQGVPDMPVAQRAEFLGIIVKESERLTRLINQVLDMAKIDSGRVDWRSERVDLRGLLNDACNATSQLFRDKGVALALDLDAAAPAAASVITGDTDRLTQVFINLLSNAVKFCPDADGRVAVRLRADAARVRIEVEDNGPGIPADQLQQVFEKFHQVSSQQAGKPKGTGLGLPISQKIVERHGGRIWADSAPGRGATFIVELPHQPVPAADAYGDVARLPQPAAGG
ncbi:Na+/proline symporter [Plasticicumulans lactativorans]|uniref:histidine kinase n=1 Tax=Plasticicumulans lactativorans TaxID=1133106 RepID=A0A4R2L7L9_9GAMM|nr:sensor histidine kinase [Plasticicumulans lactativorans]TCO82636.1 Na+/proline symporter [Plasticicumulans lactativorans]